MAGFRHEPKTKEFFGGYEPEAYFGYGYMIEVVDYYGATKYRIFRVWSDGYIDDTEVAWYANLKEAKNWCKANAR